MNEADFIPYTPVSNPESGSVLVLAPHPDDEVLGCAGAIIRHLEAGDPVQVVIITDATLIESAAYAEIRRQETKAAAQVLGYTDPIFWDLPDRGVQYGERLVQRIAECVEQHQAEWVYAPSCREIHPDHRAVALAAADAVRRCTRAIRLVMYEVGIPLQPNRLLDITNLVERKQAAMACFPSQLERQAYDRQVSALNVFRTYSLPSSVQAAEAFRVVTRDQLRADPVTALRQETFAAPGWSAETSLALPLVSVIVYNMGRAGLPETLDSIALQTYPQIEILVGDPLCSVQPALPEWWGRFPLRRIPADRPLAGARIVNLGLDLARGDYLTLIDEAAMLDPDHIAALVDILRQTARAECAISAVVHSDDQQWAISDADVSLNELFAFGELWVRGEAPLRSVVFARTLLARGCRFDEELTGLEELDFLLQLSQHSLFIRSGRTTVHLKEGYQGGLSTGRRGTAVSECGAALFDKWRMRWSGKQWADFVRNCDSRIEMADRTTAELREELTACAAELERQRAIIAELETGVRRARDDGESLRSWALGLQQTVASLQASSSWKVTRPLRWLARLIRQRMMP